MVTLEKLTSEFTTMATTAGANTFIIGYIEDLHIFREKASTHYPILRLQPPDQGFMLEVDDEQYQITASISCHYLFNRNDFKTSTPSQVLLERSKAWDSAISIFNSFIEEIHNNDNFSVTHEGSPYPLRLIPEGQNLENTVTVFSPEINMVAYCTIT